MVTAEQLSDIHLLHYQRDMHYSVQPRYTTGSPGVVDRIEALEVARAEIAVHADALQGVYGDDDRHRADVVGLDGISVLRVGMPRHWRIYDLITRGVYEEPFVGTAGSVSNMRTFG